ncbi:Ribokinase-like protein [Catenaria anguillulae PL171]|uniref:Ribokinase-like protein n=1 Tax=Catenaria anguillulae PL171 TaxID=765915 RepID=A0A1Y2H5W8_9FUNG|nr:Ribokinase-like protein [Catenaria anguillulae PL171]
MANMPAATTPTTSTTTLTGFADPIRPILCIGVNPAFQTTLHFESFSPGKVNRAFKKTHSIGGKGQNVAIAVQQLGLADKVCVLQFSGGVTGKYICDALREKRIATFNVPVAKPTRTCTTVLDYVANGSTELIEPSSPVTPSEVDAFRDVATRLMASGALKGIALCGTFPAGVDGALYQFLTQHKPTEGCVLLLDAYRGVEGTLMSGKVDVVKINGEEARSLVGVPPTTPLAAVGHEIMSRYPLGSVAITNGALSAFLFVRTSGSSVDAFEYHLPSLESILAEANDADDPLLADVPPADTLADVTAEFIQPRPTATQLSDTLAVPGTTSQPSPPSPSSVDLTGGCGSPLAPRPRRVSRSGVAISSAPQPALAPAPRPRSKSPLPPRLNSPATQALLLKESSAALPSPIGGPPLVAAGVAADVAAPRAPDVGMPRPQLVLNPLGAGDTCSGVMLAKYVEGARPGDWVDAFRYGLAAASASCLMTESTAHFEVAVMEAVYARVKVDKV